MDSRVQQVMKETGATQKEARQMLADHSWNVDDTIKIYKFMKHCQRPPGPQKNTEPTSKTLPNKPARPLPPSPSVAKSASPQPPGSPSTINRKLRRGLSKTTENITLVNRAREIVMSDISEDSSERSQHLLDTPEYTFILPDITAYPDDFRAFLHKDLIETSTLVSLEQSGRLNWWADVDACQRLLPLATTGDGNCLLHAASLGMWGFHDRKLTLRKALFSTLDHSGQHSAFYRRWRWHQTQANKEFGLKLNQEEWQTEWKNCLKLASANPRHNPGANSSCCDSPATKGLMERTVEKDNEEDDSEVFYESLEEFHVFVLAHVLRRPIIVVADTILRDSNGEPMAPIPFGGIYLPLEAKKSDCVRSPLLLTYDAAHFSALVAMDAKKGEEKTLPPVAIPLVDPDFNMLPVHFAVDPGPKFNWDSADNPDAVKSHQLSTEKKVELIKQYLCVVQVPIPGRGENGLNNEVANGHKHELQRTMSVESDESGNSSSGGKDNKDRSKVAKQMQTVAKSFGSIGKSVGKKLKKMGKAGKWDSIGRKGSVGSVTQSTKFGNRTSDIIDDKDNILCAKVNFKRLEYQEKFIQNYLQTARERFELDKLRRREQDEEMQRKAHQRQIEKEITEMKVSVNCINPACHGKGTVATSYLCDRCYDEQKMGEDRNYGTREQYSNTFPKPNSGKTVASAQYTADVLKRQDTFVNTGKSKFYTDVKEDHVFGKSNENLSDIDKNLVENQPNNVIYSKDDKKPLHLARSSFYDESLTDKEPPSVNRPAPAVTTVFVNNLHDGPEKNTSQLYKNVGAYDKPMYQQQSQPPPPPYSKVAPGQSLDYGRNMFSENNKCANKTAHLSYQPVETYDNVPLNDPAYSQSQNYNKYPDKVQLPMRQKAVKNREIDSFPLSVRNDNPNPNSAGLPSAPKPLPPVQNTTGGHRQKCQSDDCTFYGTPEMEGYCSACYKNYQKTLLYRSNVNTGGGTKL